MTNQGTGTNAAYVEETKKVWPVLLYWFILKGLKGGAFLLMLMCAFHILGCTPVSVFVLKPDYKAVIAANCGGKGYVDQYGVGSL